MIIFFFITSKEGMSINQAAIHHNLPYSSLYGRINRLKRGEEEDDTMEDEIDDETSMLQIEIIINTYRLQINKITFVI